MEWKLFGMFVVGTLLGTSIGHLQGEACVGAALGFFGTIFVIVFNAWFIE